MRRVNILMILIFSLFVIGPMSLYAGEIGPGGFVSPSIFNYNGLGLPFINEAPIEIGGNTHTTDDNNLRYTAFGAGNCVDGECIGSNFSDTGYIDIVLATPVLRAGGWVGVSSGNIQFFDESDALLGTVLVTPIAYSSMDFAGWQADTGLIKRIRINDSQENGLIVTFDDLTVENSLPDLIVSSLAAGVRTYGTPMVRGVFANYMVTNQGSGDAVLSCLDFYLSRDTVLDGGDVYVGRENIPGLAAGNSYGSFKGFRLSSDKWQPASGTWRVIADADACGDNAESDETNNQTSTVAGITVK